MKNAKNILLFICSLSLVLVLGIFIGRNMKSSFIALKENTTPIPSAADIEVLDYRLDINTATKVQLMDLPGIGEVIAERIIGYRVQNGPFTSTDDLLAVDGIGEAKLQQIMEFIRVGG